MGLPQIIKGAEAAQLRLESDGHNVEAAAVQRLLVSRTYSASLNKVRHTDLARVRALIRRAHDAMSRREPDGISTEEWNALVADLAKELGVGNG